jgi:hypothetical protein
MKLEFARVQRLLKTFDFSTLFREELGWEPMRSALDVAVGEEIYHLDALAHKRGFTALRCQGQIPPYAIRRKIDSQAAKSYHEHLIIYTDPAQTTQVWQWVKRQIGRPVASREHTFRSDQSGMALIQKLEYLVVALEEEDELTILDVAEGVRSGFDVERVTKRFYDRFKDEHTAFLKFVKGIPEEGMQRWYVSVILNRLMFVYFIQKKGFLDGDPDYLRRKLAESQEGGKDRFYTDFLCPLFFRGFAQKEHDAATVRLLGQVPFLNGGIFAMHQIEELYGEKLDIPDKAFERLFVFFDAYQWHLDERPVRRDDEINPDVLGYIFEKYINQKQMGAYYTKEDITGYISKNTVIPHLFDAARKECKSAFDLPSPPGTSAPEAKRSGGGTGGEVWRFLQEDPDRYIYAAVRKGVDLALPPEIAAGVGDVSKRARWNAPASEKFALPTEIWREVVSRRQRYEEAWLKMVGGEIHDINDLITLNLDIRQFAQDVIENAEVPELLRAFWKAIRSVTILDPTVGSGAFLFAALNVLEPLYEACLERMQAFVDELDSSNEAHSPEKFSDFHKVLAEVERHPNRRYFVLKSIIVNNLYGVDIMEEAVEICKLRLFLKLVAQVERTDQVEPLPDIDFNIRPGNTLVGFATKDDVRRAVEMTSGGQMKLVSTEDNAILKRIEEKAQDVERLFALFRQQQTELGGEVRPEDKAELRRRLKELDDELNIYLARQYGIHDYRSKEFAKWQESHRPFHWFLEFFGILRDGGFDVIIGNPPYVEYRLVQDSYRLMPGYYRSEDTDNLYAYCMERSTALTNSYGWFGMIVPVGVLGLSNSLSIREVLLATFSLCYCSTFSVRPSKLFEGVDQRLCIFLGKKDSTKPLLHTTQYNRWNAEERPVLFAKIGYQTSYSHNRLSRIPQLSTKLASSILSKLEERSNRIIRNYYLPSLNGFRMHYHRSPNYWIRAMDFEPLFKSPTKSRSNYHFRDLHFVDKSSSKVCGAILNSSLFFFWFIAVGNGRNVTEIDVEMFPVGDLRSSVANELPTIFDKLMQDYKDNSRIRSRGDAELQEFQPGLSKPIIDEIDRVLARHYGLTAEELDFIINYDIKYRMGAVLEGEE